MSWRTVVITKRCKLDLKMGTMIVRSEDTKRILLDEISVIIIENSAVSITGCLLTELAKRKIKLVFCDDKHNPAAELVSLYGSYDNSSKIRRQITWDEDIKAVVWTAIVSEKISQQAKHLSDIGHIEDAERLYGYLDEIEFNDETNREGHAAKVYFNSLFGVTFSRDNLINKLYAYLSSKTQMSENYERMLQINNAVSGFISSIGFDENLDIDFNSSVDLSLLFKSVDLRFSDDGKSLSEKLIDYITYIRELEGDKIFVFVNLLMFVSYEERKLFFQTIIDHRFTVLLLEGTGVSVSGNVNQIIIDNDLCVI